VSPFFKLSGGVKSQLLIVLISVVFWKLAAMYDVLAPL
jgi:hypothetical protein